MFYVWMPVDCEDFTNYLSGVSIKMRILSEYVYSDAQSVLSDWLKQSKYMTGVVVGGYASVPVSVEYDGEYAYYTTLPEERALIIPVGDTPVNELGIEITDNRWIVPDTGEIQKAHKDMESALDAATWVGPFSE